MPEVPLLNSSFFENDYFEFHNWSDVPNNLATFNQLKKMKLRPGQDSIEYVMMAKESEDSCFDVKLFDANKAVPRERSKSGKALPLTEKNLFSSLKTITESIYKRHEAIDEILEKCKENEDTEDESFIHKWQNIAAIQLSICMKLEELKGKFLEAHGVSFFNRKSTVEVRFSDAVFTLEAYLKA